MTAREVRSAIEIANDRVDAASGAVAAHLEDVPAHLLDDLHEAFGAHAQAERDRLVYELGRHLPSLAPALRALAEHIGESDEDLDRVGGCCHVD